MQKFISFKTNKIALVFFNNQNKPIYFKKSKSTAPLLLKRFRKKTKPIYDERATAIKCVWHKSREKMP